MSAITSRVPPSAGRILSVNERKRIQNELDYLRRTLAGQLVVVSNKKSGDTPNNRKMDRLNHRFSDPRVRVNPTFLRQKIAKLEKALEIGSPKHLTPRQKMMIERQVKADGEWLKSKLASGRVHRTMYGHPDFEMAKKMAREEMTPEFSRVASRWKNNMRRLEPESAEASNIEKLRPD